MHKKFMLACMAIAAFSAFVIAPAASATTLTSNGKVVPVGTSVTGLNEGVTKFVSEALTVECDHDHLTGTVTKNNTEHVVGEIPIGWAKFNGTGASTDCTAGNLGSAKVTVTSKLCITAGASDILTVTGCGGNVVFDLEVTGLGNCKYSVASITGTYTTNTSPVSGSIFEKGAARIEGGFFCPPEGKLTMVFNLYTTDGTPLTIS